MIERVKFQPEAKFTWPKVKKFFREAFKNSKKINCYSSHSRHAGVGRHPRLCSARSSALHFPLPFGLNSAACAKTTVKDGEGWATAQADESIFLASRLNGVLYVDVTADLVRRVLVVDAGLRRHDK